MRFILLFIVGLVFVNTAIAQNSTHKATEINFYTQQFSLSEAQKARVASVLERKYVSYDNVKRKGYTTDRMNSKMASIYKGTLNSIQMILDSEKQVEAFRQYKIELRKNKAHKVNQLRKGGLSPRQAELQYYADIFFPKG